MKDFKEIDRIASLLAELKTGPISEARQREITEWRNRSPENELLFERWQEGGGLGDDFKEFNAVDCETPKAEMLARIGASAGSASGVDKKTTVRSRMSLRRKYGAIAASAAAVILLGLGIGLLVNRPVVDDMPASAIARITPQIPVMYFDDGKEVTLEDARVVVRDGKVIVHKNDGTESTYPSEAAPAGGEVNYTTVIIPRGIVLEMELEDGTHVWLNADTRLRYPVVFGNGIREVELSGEAFFHVAEDVSRPFRVVTGGQTVEVLGTVFNVNAYPGEECVYTTLLEGSVKVSSSSGEVLLQPGMQSVASGDSLSVRKVNTDKMTGWLDGMFVLEEQTLGDVMSAMGRWYNFDVIYEDESLRHTIYKGVIPRYDNMMDVLDILHRTGEVSFRVDGNVITVGRSEE